MRTFNKRRADTCNLCKKPRLYGGNRRCTCGDPIGYHVTPAYPQEHTPDDTLRFVRDRLEYAQRELHAVARSGNPIQFRKDIRSLSRWLHTLEALLPQEEATQ